MGYAIMSVPYKIEASEELLLGNQSQQPRASQKIPIIARPFVSERAQKTLDIVEKFVEEECIPADPIYAQQIGEGVATRFSAHPPILEDLKKKKKKKKNEKKKKKKKKKKQKRKKKKKKKKKKKSKIKIENSKYKIGERVKKLGQKKI